MFDKTTLNALKTPLPAYKKPGPGGMKYNYVKIGDVIDKLNAAFGYSWSSEIIKIIHEAGFVMCHIAVSVIDSSGHVVKKHAVGGEQVKVKRGTNDPVDLGNSYASAVASALKQAAKQFGVKIGEEDNVDKPTTAPRKQPATKRPPMESSRPPMPTRSKPQNTNQNKHISGVDLVNQTMKNLDSPAAPKSGSVSVKTKEAPVVPFQQKSGKISEFQVRALEAIAKRLDMTPAVLISKTLDASDKTAFIELTRDEAVKVIGYGNELTWKDEGKE